MEEDYLNVVNQIDEVEITREDKIERPKISSSDAKCFIIEPSL